jgi:hypothetical protein
MARPQVHPPAGQSAPPVLVVADDVDQDTLAERPSLASSVLIPRLIPTVISTEIEYDSERDREHPVQTAQDQYLDVNNMADM